MISTAVTIWLSKGYFVAAVFVTHTLFFIITDNILNNINIWIFIHNYCISI